MLFSADAGLGQHSPKIFSITVPKILTLSATSRILVTESCDMPMRTALRPLPGKCTSASGSVTLSPVLQMDGGKGFKG